MWFMINREYPNTFYILLNKAKGLSINTNSTNMICSKYQKSVSGTSDNTCDDKAWQYGGTFVGSQAFTVRDTSYTDAATFKTAMSGAVLYYELAKEEIIDISDLLAELDEDAFVLPVETGGTLTFKNHLGDGYRIPVPNSEEYVLKLSEVASNE